MKIAATVEEIRSAVKAWKKEGLSVGFVPTMGYLHEGHQSLMQKAVSENDRVVVSIFVNPMQFGPSEDLESYPRDLEKDASLCEASGVDLIFHPEPKEMYHSDFSSFVDMHGLTESLCGKSRPAHFRGVCTVVTKLFNIVQPDCAYFGQKDAQQVAVIRRMTEDLNMNVKIVAVPIVREPDGLAMSSRNKYLDPAQRQAALVLSRSLEQAASLLTAGERDSALILAAVRELIDQQPLAEIDYVSLVDPLSLAAIERVEQQALLALAVKFGKTRLIDNMLWEAK